MALIDITVSALAAAIRADETVTEITAEVTRLRSTASAMIEKYADAAPVSIKNEACVRLCGYWYDAPQASRGAAYADAFANSGAKAMLAPYRSRRAGLCE